MKFFLRKLKKIFNQEKIYKALVEGRLLKRTRLFFWRLLKKIFIRTEEEIDFFFF